MLELKSSFSMGLGVSHPLSPLPPTSHGTDELDMNGRNEQVTRACIYLSLSLHHYLSLSLSLTVHLIIPSLSLILYNCGLPEGSE